MLIANPIYDEVFKYLMADLEIARGVLAAILDEDIVQLDIKAQENIHRSETGFLVYHLDFIAKIRAKSGGYKNVLIELQKSNHAYDIMRFRRYVGAQYQKEDEVISEDGTVSKVILPMVTIYFLGFFISRTLPGVIKVNRRYIDVLGGGKVLDERNDFIEKLSHNCYVIQIPALELKMRTRLEYVLSIFRQENFIDDTHRLKAYEHETDDQLMRKILRQLEKAAADRDMLRVMELEEMAEREYENAFGSLGRRILETEAILDRTEGKLDRAHKELKQKNRVIVEKDKTIEEKDKALKEKEKYIKELLEKLETKS